MVLEWTDGIEGRNRSPDAADCWDCSARGGFPAVLPAGARSVAVFSWTTMRDDEAGIARELVLRIYAGDFTAETSARGALPTFRDAQAEF
jgi:hypothetical protein